MNGELLNDIAPPWAESQPLRRDMVAVLTYVRDHKVTGTKQLGAFPLKVVGDLAARLVDPPFPESPDGKLPSHIKSELDVGRLAFLHNLAFAKGAITGGPQKRCRLTDNGNKFLDMPAVPQVFSMLAAWWYLVDWRFAFPMSGLDKGLPETFRDKTLEHLLALPVGDDSPLEPFADALIADTGFTWSAAGVGMGRMILHHAVRAIVVDVLSDFGVVEDVREERPSGNATVSETVALRVTPPGKLLLEVIRSREL